LTQLRGREQQRDGLLAQHALEVCFVQVWRRRQSGVDRLFVTGGADEGFGRDSGRALAHCGDRGIAPHGDFGARA
jgi:hypothetical protein